MKQIILFGAGKVGNQVGRVLKENGIEVDGFADSYKRGETKTEWGGVMPIYSIEYLQEHKEDYVVIITIKDAAENIQMKEKLEQLGISITTFENEVAVNGDCIRVNRKYIADAHKNGNPYYEKAEKHLKEFWDEQSIFYSMFMQLDKQNIVELACGHGRHVPQYIHMAETIVLVDILEKNIEFCKERFKGESKIEYYVNNGYDLKKLESDSYTALFTYDAMVHFELLDIFEYLKETRRILKNGGKALFHHSNNTENYKVTFATGENGRNYMSKDIFAYLANRAGLKIVEQKIIDWNGVNNLDCVSLVEKI